MKNLVLLKPTILREHLTYHQACVLLERAEASPCAEHFVFMISLKAGALDNDWTFEATPRALQRAFVYKPENFVIQDVE